MRFRSRSDVDDPIALFVATGGKNLLRVIAALLLIGLSIATFRHLVVYGESPSGVALPAIALSGIVIALIQRGFIKLASIAFLWGLLGLALLAAITVAGMQTPGLLFIPLVVVFSGWFLGYRHSVLITLASVSCIAFVAWQHQLGHLPSQHRDPIIWALTYIFFCLIGAWFGISASESIRKQHRQAASLGIQLSNLLDSATEVAIVAYDLDGRISLFNAGASRMLGYSPTDMQGKSIQGYLPAAEMARIAQHLSNVSGEHVPDTLADILAVIAATGTLTRLATYVRNDGCEVNVSVVTSVVRDPTGTVNGFISIARDISGQIKAEEDLLALNARLEERVHERTEELSNALDKLRRAQEDLINLEKISSLGSIVAGVSHELNTPIGNAVTVTSALLEELQTIEKGLKSGKLRRSELEDTLSNSVAMADLIDRSVNRAATLVSSFREISAEQVAELRREFDVRELVNKVIQAQQSTFLPPRWHIANNVPVAIRCESYPVALEQLLGNLIRNAITHAFAGRNEGNIRVTGWVSDESLVLKLEDDGVGIDKAMQAKIFDPFFTTKFGQGGSGLGLFICHRIATSVLGGNIRVESSPDHGTAFTISFPIRTPGQL